MLNRYLAADMQLYALSLVLTLAMWKWRRGAIFALTALLAGTITLIFALAYAWRLIPTYVMHSPELVSSLFVMKFGLGTVITCSYNLYTMGQARVQNRCSN